MFLIFGVMMTGSLYSMDEKRIVKEIDKTDPSVSLRIWFKAGAKDDPAGKEGLAMLTAQMLSEGGTARNTYEQILEKMFPMASSYYASASMEMTIFAGRVHKDNLDDYLKLFYEQLLTPAFGEEDFSRIKQNSLNYLKTTLKYSNDEELGKAVLYNNIFAATPYGHITSGTISGLESITLQDVKDFYAKYFNRNNFVLGIGGDVSENLVKQVWDNLMKLPEGKENTFKDFAVKEIKGKKVTIVEKNASATAISMGFPMNLLRGSREWYALAIANSWLGEHRNSSSHLYQVIREQRGLNYGDYSYIENFPNGGRYQLPPVNVARNKQIFEIWIRPVPNETKHFAFRAAMREFKKLVEDGMAKEDFELTRKFLKNYVLNFATTTNERLGYRLDDKFYGISGGHLLTYRKMMDEITLEEVNSAIKKHWQYGNMEIVFITDNAQELTDALASDKPSPISYATPKSQDILEEDKEIINFPVKIDKNSIKTVKVEDLFK